MKNQIERWNLPPPDLIYIKYVIWGGVINAKGIHYGG